eukprot:299152_1
MMDSPIFVLSPPTHGVIKCRIENIDEYIKDDCYPGDINIELKYLDSTEKIWQSIRFTDNNINVDGVIYFKVKVDVKGYELMIRARIKIKNSDWSPYSDNIKIQITSSLMDKPFSIDEIVKFKQENNVYLKKGIIVNILPDNCLQIMNFKTIQQGDMIKIHASRVYHDSVYSYNLLDLSNRQFAIDKTILLKTNDEIMINIYKCLNAFYCQYAIDTLYEDAFAYTTSFRLTESDYISRFIAMQICNFLLSDNYKLRICCLKDSNDGYMELINGRSEIILGCIEQPGNMCNVDGIDGINCYCDICRVQINGYEYKYICNAVVTDRHDICLTCAYNIVQQYKELYGLLYGMLINDMNNDCITEIVTFVIGIVQKY